MTKSSWLPAALSVLLGLQPLSLAQVAAPAASATPVRQTLKVVPLAGNNEQNDMERGVMAPLVVQVLDQNGSPVEAADVVFRFPVNGPSAALPDQKTSIATKTNADGQCAAAGWKANGQAGTFQVRVTATRGPEMGEANITMTNVTRITEEGKTKKKGFWSSRWVKIGILAGAAAAVTAVVLANTGSESTAAPPTVIISPGGPTVGGPQ